MNKKTFYIIIGIVVSILLATNIYTYLSLTRKPKVYNITMSTDDLILKDLNIVSLNNYLYIDKGSFLQKKDINKNISDISIEASIEQNILNFSIEKPFIEEKYYLDINKIVDTKLSKDSVVKVSIKYIVDGTQKEFHDNIKVIDYRVKDI